MTLQVLGADKWTLQTSCHPDPTGSGPQVQMRRLDPGESLPRHLHCASCAMLVVDGTALVSGYGGRAAMSRGMLAIRPSFDARTIEAGAGGFTWLELPWRLDRSLGTLYESVPTDTLMLGLTSDLASTQAQIARLQEVHTPLARSILHWVDTLADAIAQDAHLSISAWARAQDVSREAVARSFGAAYGVTPARFRLELRARNAWARIIASRDSLAAIALETGFADQSHMTRSVKWLTGHGPTAWRARELHRSSAA